MFLSEKDLVKKLKQNYSNICYWDTVVNPTKVLEEVDLGFGVADLVISKLKTGQVSKSAFLNYFDITIYKIIEINKGITFEKIKNITRADSLTIKKSLEKLALDSYIKERDTFYEVKSAYKNYLSETIAIEAKLKNWKRALNQAYRYKWFATKVYVVLDSKNITAAFSNLEHFKKMNVGLATIDRKGDIVIVHKPKKEKPVNDKMQMLLSEQVWSNQRDKRKDFHIAK